jgi:hypothetical protein
MRAELIQHTDTAIRVSEDDQFLSQKPQPEL